jgi:C-5 cytosine-specific DNA methylase
VLKIRKGEILRGVLNDSALQTGKHIDPPSHPELPEPLKSFDLFAGCGGMTTGLHNSGLCRTYWANEFEPSAAEAFKKNFPKAEVFVEDINTLLGNILKVNF